MNMICEDSILATTFTTANLSSPSCAMKQSRTLKVIPFVHTLDDDDDDEEEEDEDEEELEGLHDEDDSRNKYPATLNQQQRGQQQREQDSSSSSSSVAPVSGGGGLFGGLDHIQQQLHQLSRANERLISSPSSSSCSPSNEGSRSDARPGSALLPAGYHLPSAAGGSLVLTAGGNQHLHAGSQSLLVGGGGGGVLNELPQTCDRLGEAAHCLFAPMPSSPPYSSSAATSPPSSSNGGPLLGQQANHAQFDDESRITSSGPSHQGQQLHNPMHGQDQLIPQQQHIASGLLRNNNQQDPFHHQMLNHESHMSHHLSPNNNGSLPPFCTL